jgi:hypothetical protein
VPLEKGWAREDFSGAVQPRVPLADDDRGAFACLFQRRIVLVETGHRADRDGIAKCVYWASPRALKQDAGVRRAPDESGLPRINNPTPASGMTAGRPYFKKSSAPGAG